MERINHQDKSGSDYEYYSAWRMWVVFTSAALLAITLIGGSVYRIVDFLIL